MVEKIMKKYGFILFLLGGGSLAAMELDLVGPVQKTSVLEKIVVMGENPANKLYQIESVMQKGPTCGYFSLSNSIKIMSYVMSSVSGRRGDATKRISLLPVLAEGKGEVEYKPCHGFDWNKDFFDMDSRARQVVLERGMITLRNEQLPASVRDIMQASIKKNTPEDPADVYGKDRDVLANILGHTLNSIEPKVEVILEKKSQTIKKLTWSFNKDAFIEQFKQSAVMVKQKADVDKETSIEYKARAAVIVQQVSTAWLDIIFDKDFETNFSFGKDTPLGERVHAALNSGGWLTDDDLVALITYFKLEDKGMPIDLLGGRSLFQQELDTNKIALKEGSHVGSVKSIVDHYKASVSYNSLEILRNKMKVSDADIVHGFVVRLGSLNKPSNFLDRCCHGLWSLVSKTEDKDAAHWVSFVVARIDGTVCYFVADSLYNKVVLENPIITGIISFLENKPLCTESLYYIDPLYLDAAQVTGEYYSEIEKCIVPGYLPLKDFMIQNNELIVDILPKPGVHTTEGSSSPTTTSKVTNSLNEFPSELNERFFGSSFSRTTGTYVLAGALFLGVSLFVAHKMKKAPPPPASKEPKKDCKEDAQERDLSEEPVVSFTGRNCVPS